MKKKFHYIVFSHLVAVLLLMAVWPILNQNKQIYRARRYPAILVPGEGDMKEYRRYTAADGHENWGLFIEPPSSVAAQDADGDADTGGGSESVVVAALDAVAASDSVTPVEPAFYLFFNGNASIPRDKHGLLRRFASDSGCTFFLPDYRGYGFNDGRPTEKNLMADILGAYDTMEAEGRFDRGVGVIGYSLGGAAAIALALERPVDRLIVVSTFTSVDDIAPTFIRWPYHHFVWSHWANDERFPSLMARPTGERPAEIYLFHGAKDRVVPIKMGNQLASAPGPGLKYKTYRAATHENVFKYAEKDILAILLEPVSPMDEAMPSDIASELSGDDADK